MNYKETYQEWLTNPYFDEDTKKELKAIENDDNEIKERFYADLAFGTAGLRGIIGAGINRMNIYVVRKATQGLADYILEQNTDKNVLRSLSIPDICLRNLRMKLHAALLPTESKLLSLNLFALHRNYLSQ